MVKINNVSKEADEKWKAEYYIKCAGEPPKNEMMVAEYVNSMNGPEKIYWLEIDHTGNNDIKYIAPRLGITKLSYENLLIDFGAVKEAIINGIKTESHTPFFVKKEDAEEAKEYMNMFFRLRLFIINRKISDDYSRIIQL